MGYMGHTGHMGHTLGHTDHSQTSYHISYNRIDSKPHPRPHRETHREPQGTNPPPPGNLKLWGCNIRPPSHLWIQIHLFTYKLKSSQSSRTLWRPEKDVKYRNMHIFKTIYSKAESFQTVHEEYLNQVHFPDKLYPHALHKTL